LFKTQSSAPMTSAMEGGLRHQLLAVCDRLVDRQLRYESSSAAEQIQRAKLDQPLEELSPLVLRHLVP
jgi:hypothetical protein